MFPALQILHPFSAYSMYGVECTVGLSSFPGSVGARHCCPRGTCAGEFRSYDNFIRQVPLGAPGGAWGNSGTWVSSLVFRVIYLSRLRQSRASQSASVGKHPCDASSWLDHTQSLWGRTFGGWKSTLSPCMCLFRFLLQVSPLHWSQFLWTEVPSSILKFILIYEA